VVHEQLGVVGEEVVVEAVLRGGDEGVEGQEGLEEGVGDVVDDCLA